MPDLDALPLVFDDLLPMDLSSSGAESDVAVPQAAAGPSGRGALRGRVRGRGFVRGSMSSSSSSHGRLPPTPGRFISSDEGDGLRLRPLYCTLCDPRGLAPYDDVETFIRHLRHAHANYNLN